MHDLTDDREQRTDTIESLHGTGDRLLDDRFRFEELLGHNRLTSTWRCRDVLLDRPVVIRMAHRHVLTDQVALRRHRLESLAAASFTHPHLVGQFDAVVGESRAYTVTEFVPGPTLAAVFAAVPLVPAEVAAIGAQISSALAAAHHVGIVHRGVRPRQVLLGLDGRTRLTDLASAHLPFDLDGAARGPGRAGVPDRPVEFADDVRDLGAMLAEAELARPRDDHADRSVVGRLVHRMVDTPPSDETSDRLRELLELATHRRASRRPPAAQLAERFRSLCAARTDEVLRGVLTRLETPGEV